MIGVGAVSRSQRQAVIGGIGVDAIAVVAVTGLRVTRATSAMPALRPGWRSLTETPIPRADRRRGRGLIDSGALDDVLRLGLRLGDPLGLIETDPDGEALPLRLALVDGLLP